MEILYKKEKNNMYYESNNEKKLEKIILIVLMIVIIALLCILIIKLDVPENNISSTQNYSADKISTKSEESVENHNQNSINSVVNSCLLYTSPSPRD